MAAVTKAIGHSAVDMDAFDRLNRKKVINYINHWTLIKSSGINLSKVDEEITKISRQINDPFRTAAMSGIDLDAVMERIQKINDELDQADEQPVTTPAHSAKSTSAASAPSAAAPGSNS